MVIYRRYRIRSRNGRPAQPGDCSIQPAAHETVTHPTRQHPGLTSVGEPRAVRPGHAAAGAALVGSHGELVLGAWRDLQTVRTDGSRHVLPTQLTLPATRSMSTAQVKGQTPTA